MIKISAGTAHILGFKQIRADVLPSTAYLLKGERCVQDCAFCPQARNATSRADLLSRITWLSEQEDIVASHLVKAYNNVNLKRVCLQVVDGNDLLNSVKKVIEEIKATQIPLSVSARVKDIDELIALAEMGVERIGLALDAASARIYQKVKTGNWEKNLALIYQAAQRLPGRISTHLIIGLGETEQEAVDLMQKMQQIGVTVGLFAFTPVPGTKLALNKQPALTHYRRMQVANYLIRHGLVDVNQFSFAENQLVSYGLTKEQLRAYLQDGKAFETSGCKHCNRPYYNERPGGVIYNYPRPLRAEEVAVATELVLGSLKESESGVNNG